MNKYRDTSQVFPRTLRVLWQVKSAHIQMHMHAHLFNSYAMLRKHTHRAISSIGFQCNNCNCFDLHDKRKLGQDIKVHSVLSTCYKIFLFLWKCVFKFVFINWRIMSYWDQLVYFALASWLFLNWLIAWLFFFFFVF